ncbi:carbohydrate ABC transporter permease [Catenibacillus scindens]|uniref:carbohydrate ABC transporter permease n=1 Tax=Catenibacillus scindens TaxID=673271 RepID=UPI003207B532
MKIFKKKNRFLLLSHIILILVSVAVIVPFWILFAASFTDENWAINHGFSLIPGEWSTLAYQYVLSRWQTFGKAYLITICVTVSGVLLCLVVTAPCAYMLSKKNLFGRRVITFLLVFTMLFNGGMVASYVNYTQIFHLKNTYLAYIIPNLVTSAYTIMLVKSYYQSSIPDELYESARIDGASEFGCFLRIAVPLAKPILASIALMQGIAYWNDWQNGTYYISDYGKWGIMNVLNSLNNSASYLSQLTTQTEGVPTTTMRLAIAVIGIVPLMCIYPLFQKYFVKGITMGSVKG